MSHYLTWFIEIFLLTLLLLILPFAVWYIRHRRAPIAWGRVILTLALCGDLLMTVILTLARPYALDAPPQLHLFATWREAWITQRGFDQLLLNIGVFVPLGLLLAWRFPRLRRIWAVGLCSLALSTTIELGQLFLGNGVCDVDDLLCNTLGGILGASLVCLVTHLRSRKPTRAALASLPILASAIALAAYFGSYAAHPYGVIPSATPNHTYSMRNVTVSVTASLEGAPTEATVYRIPTVTDDEIDRIASTALSVYGYTLADAERIAKDDRVRFDLPAAGLTLTVYREGGAWHLKFDEGSPLPLPPTDTAEALAAYLAPFGITLPDGSDFLYRNYEGFWAIALPSETPPYTPAVQIDKNQYETVLHIDILPPTPVTTATIRTPAEVVDCIRTGNFRYNGRNPDFTALTLTELTLRYATTTKGYLVPVWDCDVRLDYADDWLYIPALP